MVIKSKTIFNIIEGCVNTRIMIGYNMKTDHIGIHTLYSKSTNQKNNNIIYCRVCGDILVVNINWLVSNKKNGHYMCNDCMKRIDRDRYIKVGLDNPLCPTYLGVDITEKVLLHIFKDTKRMRNGNPGFDFICSNDYKIDSKSSCRRVHKGANSWTFGINYNTIADYFICLAFNNRQDLIPEHIWIIPGYNINHLSTLVITESKLDKWSKYEKPLNKVLNCCDTIRDNTGGI